LVIQSLRVLVFGLFHAHKKADQSQRGDAHPDERQPNIRGLLFVEFNIPVGQVAFVVGATGAVTFWALEPIELVALDVAAGLADLARVLFADTSPEDGGVVEALFAFHIAGGGQLKSVAREAVLADKIAVSFLALGGVGDVAITIFGFGDGTEGLRNPANFVGVAVAVFQSCRREARVGSAFGANATVSSRVCANFEANGLSRSGVRDFSTAVDVDEKRLVFGRAAFVESLESFVRRLCKGAGNKGRNNEKFHHDEPAKRKNKKGKREK
jgi:hypothetical protein